jgi:acyl-CoA thioesterase I
MTHVAWPTLCIFGDSIVMGTGSDDGYGWPMLFKNWAIANSLIKDEVFALGVSGDTVGDLLQRIECECRARLPRVIVLAIGLNDAMTDTDNRPTPLEHFERDYQKVVDIAKGYTNKIIIIGLNKIDRRATALGYHTDPKDYNDVIRKIAKENGLPFIDTYPIITSELLFDGIHPNSKGHELINSLVSDQVAKLI